MALEKSFPNIYGGETTYWRIYESNISWGGRSCHITVTGYLDEAAYDDGKQPVESRSYTLAGDAFPFAGPEDPRPVAECVEAIYDWLKTLEEWDGAVDV